MILLISILLFVFKLYLINYLFILSSFTLDGAAKNEKEVNNLIRILKRSFFNSLQTISNI